MTRVLSDYAPEAATTWNAGAVHPEPEVATDDATPPTADEATALLTRVATGDQRAFSDLYDLIAPRMLGLVRHVLKDHAQSEEVVQEVLLEVWQTASRFDPNKGKAVTWMLTMAHRRAIDRVRSAQASRDRDTKIGIRDLGRDVDTVSETVEISIEHKRVEKAMARLSDLQRQAVELAYYGGYTQSEVAEMLNIPLGTVKTRLRDGLIRLRTELGVAS
ncbi:RNA polymerase ECF family sigma subunit [Microcella alkaliphila]|uniref:RNA polymerase ECF family sigma subunit n=1 Tax=Microcella alkaliphila TaxID=279828 RepID=A0A4Q7TJQ5_9MICO|nr:ECF RNA polymerase sigma factor SigK [Microcella alkaliphila]RZT60673.1 RNA polymerase ECF family sigma subunit [Microcella alkaliphila]